MRSVPTMWASTSWTSQPGSAGADQAAASRLAARSAITDHSSLSSVTIRSLSACRRSRSTAASAESVNVAPFLSAGNLPRIWRGIELHREVNHLGPVDADPVPALQVRDESLRDLLLIG